MSWISGARARLHLLFAGRAAESRMDDEVAFHIDMETERLMREQQLSPDEAKRRALATFGGVTRHTETLREGRGLAWLSGMSLDMKLGGRMLVKYPGLTIVGGIAMAFAIWVGVVTFEVINILLRPQMPLPNGDRIVQLQNYDVEQSKVERRALHDFVAWRTGLKSVTDLGAWRDETRNLATTDGEVRALAIAATSASLFRIASATPLLGRTLVEADEDAGAPPIVVISHKVWTTRFASDSGVIGRSVQLGETHAKIVGVMREGFAFPVAHDAWMPLRLTEFERGPRAGPVVSVVGLLAPGASLEDARAELELAGKRAAAAFPETHRNLQAQVDRHVKMYLQPKGSDRIAAYSFNVFAALLLIVMCANVALLLFARAATRETELVVRSALGASRNRIVLQLIAEALVLGGVAAVVGLGAAAIGIEKWAGQFLERNMGTLPFWIEPKLSFVTVLYAVGLTVLGAVVAGAMPALKVTKGIGARLKEGTAGSGLRFGGVWTAVIVAQVAITVIFPAAVFAGMRELDYIRTYDVGFPSREYLALRLELDTVTTGPRDPAADIVRFGASIENLRQRIAAEPGVQGATFVDRLPGWYDHEMVIEVQGTDAAGTAVPQEPIVVSVAGVDANYFDVLQAPPVAGRSLRQSDLSPGATSVIVDLGFVNKVFGGGNPVGRRIRPLPSATEGAPLAWFEIVGVVKDLGMGAVNNSIGQRGAAPAGLYFPMGPGRRTPVNMLIHVRGDPLSIAPRVRELANTVDGRLRVSEFQRLNEVSADMVWVFTLWMRIVGVLTAVALLLSLAGIYAVMSFTVSRRTREIGVRVALGASRGRVVAAIFRKPLTQVGAGVLVGGVVVAALAMLATQKTLSPGQAALVLADAMLIMGACALACVVPTRRALRVQPTEALRAE